jgi:hypothetical protein
MSVDVNTLYAYGYMRTSPGLWISPDGHRFLTEAQALDELRELVGSEEDK